MAETLSATPAAEPSTDGDHGGSQVDPWLTSGGIVRLRLSNRRHSAPSRDALLLKAPSSATRPAIPHRPKSKSQSSQMAQVNYHGTGDPLSLDNIRNTLIRLEDTIIFALIERAQFAHNPKIYTRGAFPGLSETQHYQGSWLEWFLKETESFHAKARRYNSPDEYPFTPRADLPAPVLEPFLLPKLLHDNDINANASILSFYVYSIVPAISRQATLQLSALRRAAGIKGSGEYDDDGNYGSVATIDVQILQAISKRVHYGKFVSESKFRDHPAAFVPHILNPNRAALDALITKPAVERALLERLVKKAKLYGRDIGPDGEPREGNWKVDVQTVHDLYEKYIIPLTKEVEVDYLLQRLDGLSAEEIDTLSRTTNAKETTKPTGDATSKPVNDLPATKLTNGVHPPAIPSQ